MIENFPPGGISDDFIGEKIRKGEEKKGRKCKRKRRKGERNRKKEDEKTGRKRVK
jgi:hypothetical protein